MTLGNMHNNLLKIYVTCISGDRQTDTLITILSSPTDGEAIKCLYRPETSKLSISSSRITSSSSSKAVITRCCVDPPRITALTRPARCFALAPAADTD